MDCPVLGTARRLRSMMRAVTTHERRPGGLESLGDLYDAVPASEAVDVEEDAQRGGPPRMLLDLALFHGRID